MGTEIWQRLRPGFANWNCLCLERQLSGGQRMVLINGSPVAVADLNG